MAINIKFNELGIFGIVVGVAGGLLAAWQTKKTNDVAKKLNHSIDTLDRSTVVNVQQSIIDRATSNAVERQVSGAVKKAVDNVSSQIRSDIDSMIRKDVDRVYGDLKDSVKERVSEEIASIDYDEMREEIKRMAKDKVFNEFCNMTNLTGMFGNVKRVADGDLSAISDILGQFDNDWERSQALKNLLAVRKS